MIFFFLFFLPLEFLSFVVSFRRKKAKNKIKWFTADISARIKFYKGLQFNTINAVGFISVQPKRQHITLNIGMNWGAHHTIFNNPIKINTTFIIKQCIQRIHRGNYIVGQLIDARTLLIILRVFFRYS
jgi:hypothetical protein